MEAATSPNRVTADAIERELAQLWHSIGEPGEMPPVRASVLNLMVYADAEAARRALRVLASLPSRHTSRILVLIPAGGHRQQLSADVAAHCDRVGDDGRRVCHEQVTLRFGPEAVGLLPGLVLPLLLPDLPVVLWLAGRRPSPAEDISWLLGIADRIILDSAVSDQPATPLAGVEAIAADPDRTAALGDLNWGRLAPWRRIIARMFEPLEFSHLAANVDDLTVSYRGTAGDRPAAQVWLLAGWVMARLGWRPAPLAVEDFRWELPRAASTGTPRLTFIADPTCEAGGGQAGAITLAAHAGEDEAIFRILRGSDRICATCSVAVNGAVRRQSVVPLEMADDVRLLAEELNRQERDLAYERAVALVAGLDRPS